MNMKPHHRLRDDPYDDELDQQFCDECETLCILPDRPCACCWERGFMMEWLNGNRCRLIITSPQGELVNVDLEQLSIIARFVSKNGEWLRYFYDPYVYPEDSDAQDSGKPPPRRYVTIKLETGIVDENPGEPFSAKLIPDS